MYEDEYKKALVRLDDEFKRRKAEFGCQYARSNNPYKKGDVVTDHMRSIRIETIRVEYPSFGEFPCCVYRGKELKKDDTLKKGAKYRDVWQSNLKM